MSIEIFDWKNVFRKLKHEIIGRRMCSLVDFSGIFQIGASYLLPKNVDGSVYYSPDDLFCWLQAQHCGMVDGGVNITRPLSGRSFAAVPANALTRPPAENNGCCSIYFCAECFRPEF
jgi:hypothetical protein